MKQLLQETLNYLATRPYQEVYQLINKIVAQIQQLEVQEKVAKDTVKTEVNQKYNENKKVK